MIRDQQTGSIRGTQNVRFAQILCSYTRYSLDACDRSRAGCNKYSDGRHQCTGAQRIGPGVRCTGARRNYHGFQGHSLCRAASRRTALESAATSRCVAGRAQCRSVRQPMSANVARSERGIQRRLFVPQCLVRCRLCQRTASGVCVDSRWTLLRRRGFSAAV